MIDMIMFGWTFCWFHQKKRFSSDAGFVEYKGFWFAVKLITRVFSWPFDWFHGATYSLWLIPFLERTAESPWYSKCQPLIFPQGKLLSYSKDLVHYICFRCSCTVFTNNFLLISIFYPALHQQGFPKFMQAGDLSKLQISKTFYTHYTRVASFDFEEIQTQKTILFEVRSSLFLHHPVIENCLFQCAVKQPIKLMSWTIFFCANILQKEFNLLQMEQVDLWLHPSLVCEHFLALQCSLTSPLVASQTSSQIYKHILALKEFSQTTFICLLRKKAFQFELLF